tara:strand:+ start:3721 stop:5265 length:1545 start_codon:yes stop_codon:yes gene_type:complete
MKPFEAQSLPELVTLASSFYGNKEAIEDNDVSVTFIELEEICKKSAESLLALKVEPGDRICIWAPNRTEWIIAAIAVQMVKAILVPINTRFKGVEASYILKKTKAKVLFTVNNFLGVDYSLMIRDENLPDLQYIIFLDEESGKDSWNEFKQLNLPKNKSLDLENDGSLVADIIFTSGTTGSPKGVMVTQKQNLKVFENWSRHVGLNSEDRYLIVNPFFHTFGYKAGWLACLMRGALILPHQVFDPQSVLERIEKDKVSVMPGPPSLYQSIMDAENFKSFDISSLRLAVTGAATIPIQLINDMREVMKIDTVLTAYGLTESTGVVSMCNPGDTPELIANTSGVPIDGVEVKCITNEGKVSPLGQPGDIYVKGYNVMKGYYEEPEQTMDTVDEEGWLHTGDIGVINAQGYLSITDRSKDMFIVGGFNTYPAEIENILASHADISSSAIIGIPDKRLGEVAKAFVVLKEGCFLEAVDLIKWCRIHMANYKVPRKITFVSTLPLNASGKVMKYKLRKL